MTFSWLSMSLMVCRWPIGHLFVRLFRFNRLRNMHNDEFGIVTRSGGRRLRWSAAAVAVPLFGVVAAFGTVERGPELIPTRILVHPSPPSPPHTPHLVALFFYPANRFKHTVS